MPEDQCSQKFKMPKTAYNLVTWLNILPWLDKYLLQCVQMHIYSTTLHSEILPIIFAKHLFFINKTVFGIYYTKYFRVQCHGKTYTSDWDWCIYIFLFCLLLFLVLLLLFRQVEMNQSQHLNFLKIVLRNKPIPTFTFFLNSFENIKANKTCNNWQKQCEK